jgi:TolA-binding protein
MGRFLLVSFLVLLLLGGIVGGVAYYMSLPKNAQEHFERARKIEQRNDAEIRRQRSNPRPNEEQIAGLEQETRAAFQLVIDRYPDTPEAEESEYILIDRAHRMGELSGLELIARLEEFMTKYPESRRNPELMLRIARIYDNDLKLPGEAITRYQQFVEQYPENERAAEALFEIARIQERVREFEAAEATYTRIIEEYPDSELALEAQYRRGNLRADQLDKAREAMEDFKEVEQRDPESRQARVAQARRREIGQEAARQARNQAQDQYYGAPEISFMTTPLQDWNDPTVTVIREQLVDSLHYEMAVTLNPDTSQLTGRAVYTVATTTRMLDDTFIMQFNGGLTPSSITQNDKPLTFEQRGNFLHMALAEPMPANSTHTFVFEYAGTADNTWKGDVITRQGTFLRPESRWYPYTSWGDEFTVDIDITVPKGMTAVGPGLLTNTSATDTEVTFSWRQAINIGILAIVANEYVKMERDFDNGRVLLQTYMYPHHKEFGPLYLDEMEAILQYYETLFGPFPYEKMAVAEIPFFPGGYGSPTLLMITDMVFNNRRRVVAEFLAHEISHQWFGNLLGLTLDGDSHPWLSEGFATYVDALYIEHRRGHEAFTNRMLDMANLFIESLLAFEDVAMLDCLWDNPMYRTLVYEKGGLVLHTLRHLMGDDAFFAGLRDYVDRFRHRTVAVQDFQRVMEDHHGESLQWFFDQWLRQTGMPHYHVANAKAVRELTPGGTTQATYQLEVTIQQLDSPFKGPISVKIQGAGGGEQIERVWLDDVERVVLFEVPFEPTRVILDPGGHVLKYPKLEDLERDVAVVEADRQS